MTEAELLLSTLKKCLTLRGLSHRDLAFKLGLSEGSVKRILDTQRLTLDRLAQISQALGLTLVELAAEAMLDDQRLQALTEAEEKELVADERLLLVAVCALSQWTVAEIVGSYRLSEDECLDRLRRLAELRLLDVLPGNRIRLRVVRDFDWLPRGPVHSFFRQRGLADFLNCEFAREDDTMSFTHAALTDAAISCLQNELRRLRHRVRELQQESLAEPVAKRREMGLLLALREWELRGFTALRR